MESKFNLLYLSVLLLFLYACSDLIKPVDTDLDHNAIALAYADLNDVVNHIDELSQLKTQSGHWPLIHAEDKARLGVQVRKAKALIDLAHAQVMDGAETSKEYTQGRKIIDELLEEIAPLVAERELTT